MRAPTNKRTRPRQRGRGSSLRGGYGRGSGKTRGPVRGGRRSRRGG